MGTRWRRAWTFGLAAGLCGGCSSGDEAVEKTCGPSVHATPSGSPVAVEAAEAVRNHLARGVKSMGRAEMDALGPRAPVDLFPAAFPTFTADGPWLLPEANEADAREAPHADVRLSSRASGGFRVSDRRSGLSVEVALVDAAEVLGEAGAGIVAYPGGYRGVGDIVHRPIADGTEDYVFFRNALPDVPELRYTITLGKDVAGLRLVGKTLELLDERGVPRLRMGSPWAVDGDGRTVWMNVAVEGCQVSTDPRLPIGLPVVDPGARQCVVELSWEGTGVRAPLLVDPAWTTTDAMEKTRALHTANRLPDGSVLAAGGDKGFEGMINLTEIYVPAESVWVAGAPMAHARYGHTATTLPDGSILVLGGRASLDGGVIPHAEIYTHGSTTPWKAVAGMTAPRMLHTATLLADGRVLVAGGRAGATTALLAEIYDWKENVWAPAGQMKASHYGHTATLLEKDRVLVAGGGENLQPSKAAEIWNPETSTWTETAPMPRAHANHTAARLSGGRVLVVGGNLLTPTAVDVYDDAEGVWKPGPSLQRGRFQHALTPFGVDRFLVSGGGKEESPTSAEIFDPVTRSFIQVGSMMQVRLSHTSTELMDGRILVAGGYMNMDYSVNSAEIFTPPGFPCATSADCPNAFCIDGVCCDSPCSGQCEACDGERIGLCSPITGSPHGERPECVGEAACALCDGLNPLACSFPIGNSCGNGCQGSTLKVGTCDGTGACTALFSTNCAPYDCNDTTLSCETSCENNDTCADGIATCNVMTNTCTSLPTHCKDGRYLELPNGDPLDCAPYACSEGACRSTCASVDDCSGDDVICDEVSKNCMYWEDFNQTQPPGSSSGTCAASPGAPAPSRMAWLFALAAASLFAARRHRARP